MLGLSQRELAGGNWLCDMAKPCLFDPRDKTPGLSESNKYSTPAASS